MPSPRVTCILVLLAITIPSNVVIVARQTARYQLQLVGGLLFDSGLIECCINLHKIGDVAKAVGKSGENAACFTHTVTATTSTYSMIPTGSH